MTIYKPVCLLAAWLLLVVAPVKAEDPSATAPAHPEISTEDLKFFEGKIRPLLLQHCVACHGPEKQSGGLRLDLRTSAIEVGGESGPAITPGDTDDSLLLEAVKYESFEMPPDKPLSEDQVALLESWIKRGAPWPADSQDQAAAIAQRGITEEDRNYWAFRPLQETAPPTVNNEVWSQHPIDRFLLARMEQDNLQPSRPAPKTELLRRLHLDLTGLPPTQEQIQTFLNDPSPNAYEKRVDELLASPQYGEHFGRIWLDLVRYAESDGYRQDAFRPLAWRYRDYVIEAFNADKPYDQFLKEQLAGDEIAPEDPQALIATGFLRHGVYEYNQRDSRTQWQEILNEVTDTTADVFLGMGMGCARCHNHKFDPILQEDYYGLQAFFAPIFWEDDAPFATPEQKAAYAAQMKKWEEATAAIRAEIDQIEAPHLDSLARVSVNRFPEDVQEMMLKAPADRTPYEEQVASLAYRQVGDKQKAIKSRLKGEVLTRWEDLQLELDKFNKLKPAPLPKGPSGRDVGAIAPPVLLKTRRGEKEIVPHFPEVLTDELPEIVPPEGIASTGRRTALANWFVRPDHPLTSRVMINRIWQQHFGKGLVSSASDFGTLGQPPTHPELLDWLALRFMDSGWSMKQMHRMLVLTAAYQQSSHAEDNPTYDQAMLVDPQNRLVWRMSSHRLNSDQIRDSILAATGELSLKMGGPSTNPEDIRRSIYTKVIRNNQHPF